MSFVLSPYGAWFLLDRLPQVPRRYTWGYNYAAAPQLRSAGGLNGISSAGLNEVL